MNLKEKIENFKDKKFLENEMNEAKRKIRGCRYRKSNFKIFNINFEKIKNATLIAIAVICIGIGYFNFKIGEDDVYLVQTVSETGNSISGSNLGDVQLVSSETVSQESEDNTEEKEDDGESEDDDNEKEDDSEKSEVETTEETSNISSYFTQLKLTRDNMYSQKLEAYEQIANSDSISSDQKAIAIQEIENITETQTAISVAEELIKLKDFDDVVIYVNGESISVIVRAAALSKEQVAQIQNIVSRELDCDVENINISNK